MRIIIVAVMIFTCVRAYPQITFTTVPLSGYPTDSASRHRWFLTSYAGISTGITFSRGYSSTFLLAPFSLQLNRALNKNLYAFANVTAAPAFTGISPFATNIRKAYLYTPYRKFGAYSSASLGLMYVNDAKTFSISGSVGVENGNPLFLPYTGIRQVPLISTSK